MRTLPTLALSALLASSLPAVAAPTTLTFEGATSFASEPVNI